ncbi:hypothetical protein GCM10011613_12430 [Cellvibrio zantedeschiae]|uniref:PEP-CTERM protein-sorting domain-containing protein n=1 Tax=Cellvibrio zantedeschiae TaxID=1237077 RepID=A0ABQ3AWK6_9GAMM|nr:hypothetical protein [Cellvibrio zantedeschiae]GGY69603.1 hypothetical protein GCM10011613_12430 [Cellvibrio zantedeschiae]
MCDLFKRWIFGLMGCVALGIGANASAVVIDFDDRIPIYDPVFSCFCDNPLSNEYEDKGLLIHEGFLNGESHDGGVTYENFLITGPYGQLSFVGELPTFVSMRVTSLHNDVIYLSAFGENGFLEMKKTPGFGGPFDDTPAEPNFFVSFAIEEGIKFITIDAFYFRSTGAAIDDLTFTYSSVPEPSSIMLVTLACIVFLRRSFLSK